MMIALNSDILTHLQTHIMILIYMHKMYVPLLVWGHVVIGDYFSPQYTSNCSLNDMIRLRSDGAPD